MAPNRDFWLKMRQALLMAVDAIEREFSMFPRTAQLRHEFKEGNPTGVEP